ncbi:uncharacterized protein LOC132711896 [Pantherophis guttatus]|uniref:Uncharacterized protein LOC132711896 n=1 Tax=Pantherophis guttatus TaxID=94885 RepID=A0ABM3ZHF7_PANGU|nr:uncharacterized protein LOC132711896 [Pantherophis guttatus]
MHWLRQSPQAFNKGDSPSLGIIPVRCQLLPGRLVGIILLRILPLPPPPPPPLPAQAIQPSLGAPSEVSYSTEGEQVEPEFSDDEEVTPERPAFATLFRPAVFKTLLRKAKAATNMGTIVNPNLQGSSDTQPHGELFAVPAPDHDYIPCPDLFKEVIKRQWESPGVLSAPSGHDKKLYCADPALEALLNLPSVDPPVVSLSSSAVLSSDAVEVLKADERKTEVSFRKMHQAAAWAVKAATSASFFNRATLIWLRQLQERLPPGDTRIAQDFNKLVAATEYSADASLDAARFAARAMASSISSRRLLWLKPWKADSKSKWRLASAPYHGSSLFGEALDPILIEGKDKRKVLPVSYSRQERRFTPYSQRQPFRAESGPRGSYYGRQYSQGYSQGSDRFAGRQGNSDRGRFQSSSRRPFKGAGAGPRSSRRGK